jgi:hypothetical protein
VKVENPLAGRGSRVLLTGIPLKTACFLAAKNQRNVLLINCLRHILSPRLQKSSKTAFLQCAEYVRI